MEFLFDHYRKIKDPTLYLHNPDMKPISAIKARNRNFVLRFNDLSELTFEAPKYEKSKDGTMFELPYYSRLATKRLIKIDEIGWFQITQAVENEDGLTAYMSITAQSHQCAFKEKGFFCEGRLYKFYDESDPYDANYDSDKEDAIPSVVGQLYQQLGIKVVVAITDFEPDEDYGDWTIVYIDPALKYVEGATSNICRAFKDNSATYGYDFMVNSVENAFEVIFDFDFMHHAIKVKRIESVTQKTNIYLSFDNVMKELQTTEKADDIVTVLNCSGNNLDIRTVNPTGTNYIVDFSYYMDEVNHHWMSQELIDKIKSWKSLVDSKKTQYSTLVTNLRNAYEAHTEASSDIVYIKRKNQDLEAVRDQYIVDNSTANMLFVAETIEVGKKSLDSKSPYYSTALSSNDRRTCYASPPTYSGTSFSFSGSGTNATLDTNMRNNKLYYMDYSGNTYCKIVMGTRVEGGVEVNYVASVERYTVYSNVSVWLTVYGNAIDSKQSIIDTRQATADTVLAQMQAIADETNILKYFSDTPALLTELKYYWIEGDYNNDNLAVLDSTTQEQAIDLAKELFACGEKELARVCQPRFSVAVNSVKFIKIYAFRKFMYELALGKVITVEKAKDIFYYPALTQMSFSLEDDDSFELVFSNALKLNDWGFTYADLIASASNTTKNVISNWNELMDYSAHKSSIQELLLNPLDKTLRLAEKNMNNQEFVVDNTGILGRKRKAEDLFEPEQVRMINNLLLFTDDSWQTVKTALGKIVYTEDGVDKKAYGLLAEVLVGSLVMSNRMKIQNDGGTITLDKDGITIKNSDGDNVFLAKTDGSLYVGNFVEGDDYEQVLFMLNQSTGDIEISGSRISIDSTYFKVTKAGVITATSGSIGGWSIDSTGIYKSVAGMLSYDDIEDDSLVTSGETSPVRFYAGQTSEEYYTTTVTVTTNSSGFGTGLKTITQTGGKLVRASYVSSSPSTTNTIVAKENDTQIKVMVQMPSGGAKTYTVTVGYYFQPNAAFSAFKVLADGSFYASAANIRGHIEADSGYFGGLDISGNSITCTASELAFDLNEGIIKTNKLQLTGYFQTEAVMAQKISGRSENSPYLFLEGSATSVEEVTISASYVVTTEGTTNWLGNIKTEGSVTVTVTANKALAMERTFTVYGTYNDDGKTTSLSKTVTIKAGAKTATTTFVHLYHWSRTVSDSGASHTFNYTGSFSGASASPSKFTQPSSSGVGAITSSASFAPNGTGLNLGAIDNPWDSTYSKKIFIENGYIGNTYSTTGTVITSDAAKKNSIKDIDDKYVLLFDQLRPVTFKLNDGTSGRTHMGLVAQELKASADLLGIDTVEIAAYCRWLDEDGTTESYGIRYEEFIALNIHQIQKLKAKVAELEKEIKELKGEN